MSRLDRSIVAREAITTIIAIISLVHRTLDIQVCIRHGREFTFGFAIAAAADFISGRVIALRQVSKRVTYVTVVRTPIAQRLAKIARLSREISRIVLVPAPSATLIRVALKRRSGTLQSLGRARQSAARGSTTDERDGQRQREPALCNHAHEFLRALRKGYKTACLMNDSVDTQVPRCARDTNVRLAGRRGSKEKLRRERQRSRAASR
jgi:hypothetical protein